MASRKRGKVHFNFFTAIRTAITLLAQIEEAVSDDGKIDAHELMGMLETLIAGLGIEVEIPVRMDV